MSHRLGETRPAHRGKKPRGGRIAGAAAAAGTFLALGMSPLAAPRAQAEFEDLFEPLIDSIAQVDPDLSGGLDLDSDQGLDLDSDLDSAVTAGAAAAVGAPVLTDHADLSGLSDVNDVGALGTPNPVAEVPNPAADPGSPSETPETASVPLRMQANTEPVVDISVGGGADTAMLVDTGSRGVTMPIWDLGWQNLLTTLPTSLGFGAYSGGLGYFYLTYDMPIDFGNGIVTDPTEINAVLLSWPTNLDCLFSCNNWSSFFAPAGVDGVLGIGPNAYGPSDANPLDALPGDLSKGYLIDQANEQLIFGENPLTGGTEVSGSPIADLYVSIDDGPLQKVHSIIDSGGVYGTMPSTVQGFDTANGAVVPGTEISVYSDAAGQHELYSFTTTAQNAPTVVGGTSLMNTGNMPFTQQPIYVSNSGNGMTIFGGSNAIEP